MTKYFSDRNRGMPNADLPISVPNYENIYSREERFCPYCQIKLSRLIDSSGSNPSFYCSKCTIEYPDKSDTKSKSYLNTPQQKSNNESPAVSHPPELSLSKKDHSVKGGLKALSEIGRIKIKSYREGVG